MKKYISLLILVIALLTAGCSKDNNPVVTNSVINPNTNYGTLVYERPGTDSTGYGTETFNLINTFDYTNSDSIIFVFTANVQKPQTNWWISLRIWTDSSGNYICDYRIPQPYSNYPEWKNGINEYVVKLASPKRKFTNHKYYISVSERNLFIAVKNLKIYKK